MPKKELMIAAQHGLSTAAEFMQQHKLDAAAVAGGEGSAARKQGSHRKQAKARLIAGSKVYMAQSAALGAVPDAFDKDKMYRVQLSQVCLDHAGNNLRPCDDVIIRGHLAEELAEHIVSASEV